MPAPAAANPQLPLPPQNTLILGIHQSDIIIKSALEAALLDMTQVNPWVLDYVFAGLPQDTLTAKKYGQTLRQTAKDWLRKTNVPVLLNPTVDELKAPCISIQLVSSQEVEGEATTGDTHAFAFEGNSESWPDLTTPLTVSAWNPLTGVLTFAALPADIFLAPGMSVRDANGGTHLIQDVTDDTTCVLTPGTMADFRGAALKPGQPAWLTAVESSSFRETYRVGVHVGAEAAQCIWLHSAVVMALLRYKEVLLEARGFERSTFQSTDLERNTIAEAELLFSRFVNVTGYVRQYWPKVVAGRIDAVVPQTRVSGQGTHVKVAGTGVDPAKQLWVGDLDVDSLAGN